MDSLTNHSVSRMNEEKYQWFQGDLHTHTLFSDGVHSLQEAKVIARDEGLEFIALTDHNTFEQNMVITEEKEFTYIPGMELTTNKGHVNIYGPIKPLEFFKSDSVEMVKSLLVRARKNGGFISINHPFVGDRWLWGFDEIVYDAIELWNGSPLERNEKAIKWWQNQLTKGKKIIITGGSDVHENGVKNRWYGKGRTYVYAKDRTAESIVEALKQGHCGVAANEKSPFCEISINGHMMGDTVKVMTDNIQLEIEGQSSVDTVLKIFSANGKVFEKQYLKDHRVDEVLEMPYGDCFYRAEMWVKENDELKHPFFTNPIYIKKE